MADVEHDPTELAYMGGAALAIFIAMARTAEDSTSGKKKDRVDAMVARPGVYRSGQLRPGWRTSAD